MIPIKHLVNRRRTRDPEPRMQRAWSSWQMLYDTGCVEPAHCYEMTTSAKDIGDKRDLPRLREVIEFGVKQCWLEEQPILFTNDDITIHPMLVGEVWRHVRLYGAGTIRRVVVDTRKTPMPPLSASPVEFMALGYPDLGRDGFVITPKWWARYGELLPDFFLGAPCWDLCLALIVRLLKGWDSTNQDLNCLYESVPQCELPDGLLIHEWHETYWDKHKNDKSFVHNEAEFSKFVKTFTPTLDLSKKTTPSCWPPHAILRYERMCRSFADIKKTLLS